MQTVSQKFITKHQWLVHSLYGQKYWTPPSLEEKEFANCGNKDGNIIHVLFISTYVATILKCMKWLYPYVIGVWWWFLAQGLHLKSHQRCSAGIRTCLPADQSSSSTLTESSFIFDPCLTQRHCHVRIEKAPVQTVAIKLEEHKSLEYHYMLKH